MTCPTAAALPIAVVSTAVTPRERVFVRPRADQPLMAAGCYGWLTHRRTLGTMTLSVTVQLASGATMDCPPAWVTATPDWHTLLDLPR